jgi:hypothetical protein
MDRQAEVRELHEQFSAAWSLYARCTGVGEVVDLEGLRIANGRQPWSLNLSRFVEDQNDQALDMKALFARMSLGHDLE